jgi:hypothetical protein
MFQVAWALGWMIVGLFAIAVGFLPIVVAMVYGHLAKQGEAEYNSVVWDRIERNQIKIMLGGYAAMIFIILLIAAPR